MDTVRAIGASGHGIAGDAGSGLEFDAGFDAVLAVADAVLYEGYLLYPYRRSARKNQVRWQFGVLAPRPWVEREGPVAQTVAGSVESWRQQTECLVQLTQGDDATVLARVRFLQVQGKDVEQLGPDCRYERVDSLDVGGTRHLSFEEAVPHERNIAVPLADLLAADRTYQIGAPGGVDVERLGTVGQVIRRRWPVTATASLHVEPVDLARRAYRLRVVVQNTGVAVGPAAPRAEALRHSLIATHTVLGGHGLRFVSLIDPPEWAAGHARACHNVHTFPVLAGPPDRADRALSSPILLQDHPSVAPESPGDLHDAAEIDEILSLRTLTLTDEEKREARATDPRAARIVDRVDNMPDQVLARLHGAIRSLRPAQDHPETPGEGGARCR